MEGAGLTVRWLASTRVSEDKINGKGHDEAGYESTLDGRESAEVNLDPGRELSNYQKATVEDVEDHDGRDTESSSSGSESTDDDASSTASSKASSNPDGKRQYTSCIQEAQLSPDGTCIFTSDYNRAFSVYALGANETPSENSPRSLKPYAQFRSSDPIWAYVANPLFDLNDPSTSTVLVSRRDSYITLHNALWDYSRDYSNTADSQQAPSGPVDISTPLASYRLINHLTEAVTAPTSLAYSNDGNYFFAGHQNAISTFDIQHLTDPMHTIRTIPSARSKLVGGGRGFKGIISALSLSPPGHASGDGILAAGSRTRHIGLYDSVSGEEITHFPLPGSIDGRKIRSENLSHLLGDGVSSLKWSPCGNYLYVAERMSDALLIYDVRKFALSLAHCVGRKALTKQKMGFDVWNAGPASYDIEATAHHVLAGGTDGKMRIWRDPHMKQGSILPDEVVTVMDANVPVVSAMRNKEGSLAVAASGILQVDGNDEGDEEKSMIPLGVKRRGGKVQPRYREWGSLDIFGLN